MVETARKSTLWTAVTQGLLGVTWPQAFRFTLLFSILERILLWLCYDPVVYSDSASYRRLAGQIMAGWSNYDGSRVPGYPLFLAIVGSDERVFVTQLLLGIAVTLLLFFIAWLISGQAWFAALVGLAHNLNLGQLFFEANVLTETLATFLVLAATAGVIIGIYHPSTRRPWLALLVSFFCGLAVLTRPNFIYLPPWLFLWIVLGWQPFVVPARKTGGIRAWVAACLRLVGQSLRRQWLTLCALFLPAAFLILGWMGFIHRQYGDWALSTMTGYHLVQHTGNFFEYVPDEYAALRDTYLRFRDERIALYGTQANTIWEAIPAMQEAAGLNFYDLSRALADISLQLIRKHPDLFLRSVAEGWWLFWRVPVYWSPDALLAWIKNLPGLVGFLKGVILLQRLGLFTDNLFFIMAPLLRFIPASRVNLRLGTDEHSRLAWAGLIGSVWVASFVQAILDHGDNPRFLVPLQSIIVLWILAWFWQAGLPALRRLRVKSR